MTNIVNYFLYINSSLGADKKYTKTNRKHKNKLLFRTLRSGPDRENELYEDNQATLGEAVGNPAIPLICEVINQMKHLA